MHLRLIYLHEVLYILRLFSMGQRQFNGLSFSFLNWFVRFILGTTEESMKTVLPSPALRLSLLGKKKTIDDTSNWVVVQGGIIVRCLRTRAGL
jgi:hypothetical protein